MPVGIITAEFLTNSNAQIVNSLRAAEATINTELRAWYLSNLSYWSGDPLDIDAIGAAFSRTTCGEAYSLALASTQGTQGDAMSAKLQSDYLATMERAFRARHASPVRRALQAASRRLGHGDVANSPAARVQTLAQDMILAGATGFQE